MHWLKSKSLLAFIFCCLSLTFWLWFSRTEGHKLPQADITWDVSGYYLYLPELFYDDLGEMHNWNYIIKNYDPCRGNDLCAQKSPTGKYVITYSGGMAIMYLPGFAAGHICAKLFHYPIDGFSYPYQACMAIYSLLISFLGLCLIRKVLLAYFSELVTALALISICLATNYFTFAAYDGMLSHNYLFTLYAAIIYLTQQWYQKPDWKKTALTGALSGLAVITRPTEIVCVLIPLLWEVDSIDTLKNRLKLFKQYTGHIAMYSCCAILVGSIQLVYWKIYSGHFFYWSYGPDKGFDFLNPHFYSCLFSYKKGWLVYTPFMVISLLGFIPLYYRYKKHFWPMLIFTLLVSYITFSWKCWWYGGSFSMRAIIQYYAVLIFPVCAFIDFCFQRTWRAVLFIIFLLFCTWLNITMSYQCDVSYIMECDNMNPVYFWKIFGKLHNKPTDRCLVDGAEDIPKNIIPGFKEVTQRSFERDSIKTLYADSNGHKVLILGKGIKFIPETEVNTTGISKGWFRATARVYIVSPEPDFWTEPTIYIMLLEGPNSVKRNYYRIQRIVPRRTWMEIPIDIKMPAGVKSTRLVAGVCSYSNKNEVLVENVKVYYTDKEK